MDSLRDAFNHPARVPIVVVHVDLSDAAKLKTETGEVSRRPTFGWSPGQHLPVQLLDRDLRREGRALPRPAAGLHRHERRPGRAAGRAGRADIILSAGTILAVRLTKIMEKFGFADVRDSRGSHRDLFIDLGPDARQRFALDQELTVRIARNPKGPVGQLVAAEGQVA